MPNFGKTWESYSHIASLISTAVAVVALIFSGYQFRESANAQREALEMQKIAMMSEQSAKAASIYTEYLAVKYSKPPKDEKNPERFRMVRDNDALRLLNTLALVAPKDSNWQEILLFALNNFRLRVQDQQITCLQLTPDFRHRLEQMFVIKPHTTMCWDFTDD